MGRTVSIPRAVDQWPWAKGRETATVGEEEEENRNTLNKRKNGGKIEGKRERRIEKKQMEEGLELGDIENEGWKEIKDEENNKSDKIIIIIIIIYFSLNDALSNSDRIVSKYYPCGGGVEYLHREPASRKRRRNGTKKKAAP
jgi:hypothetical protein